MPNLIPLVRGELCVVYRLASHVELFEPFTRHHYGRLPLFVGQYWWSALDAEGRLVAQFRPTWRGGPHAPQILTTAELFRRCRPHTQELDDMCSWVARKEAGLNCGEPPRV